MHGIIPSDFLKYRARIFVLHWARSNKKRTLKAQCAAPAFPSLLQFFEAIGGLHPIHARHAAVISIQGFKSTLQEHVKFASVEQFLTFNPFAKRRASSPRYVSLRSDSP